MTAIRITPEVSPDDLEEMAANSGASIDLPGNRAGWAFLNVAGRRYKAWLSAPRSEVDEPVVYMLTTPKGFTETFDAHAIDILERLGLICHERDGHVLEDGHGNGVGPLHRFYREES